MTSTTPPPANGTFVVITAARPEQLIDFLRAAFDFVPNAVHRDAAGAVAHAQLDWPGGGSVLISPVNSEGPWVRPAGSAGVHLFATDVDAAFERARVAGAELLAGLTTTSYGAREFVARDPEGNLWSVGTYAGEPHSGPFGSGGLRPDEVDTPARAAAFMTEWANALVSNDVDRIAAYTTHDWVLVDTPGVITRQRFHDVVASGELSHQHMSHEVVSVRRAGDIIVALTRGRNSATFRGRRLEADEWTANVLVAGERGWRCAFTQVTPRKTTARPPQEPSPTNYPPSG